MRNRVRVELRSAIDELYAKTRGKGSSTTYTTATVTGGETYAVKNTDIVVKMDSSNGTRPTATLPTSGLTIGERHTFIWFAWDGSQVPPAISGGGNDLMPWGGMSSSGNAGLLGATTIGSTGQSFTLMWDGVEWVQAG